MNPADYAGALEKSLQRLSAVIDEIDALALERDKLMQFIVAGIPLLPEKQGIKFVRRLDKFRRQSEKKELALTDAIRNELQKVYPEWLTVREVRNQLVISGFDFSSYKSNPMAAISTTLRRIGDQDSKYKDQRVESSHAGGVFSYRMKPELEDKEEGLLKA
jgi:hypothetical protein